MKVVLWIGKDANQKALANKIHAAASVVGIVLEKPVSKQSRTGIQLLEKILERIFLPAIAGSWNAMQAQYEQRYPAYPQTKNLTVENINTQEVVDFTTSLGADLVLVSGTRLVTASILASTTARILNLHTGLSPYIKGGPNCTNWCLATAQFHLIGNTVMWIDAGIDSGNIVLSAVTPFEGNEDLYAVHSKVMEHAHTLYVQAVQQVMQGTTANIPQQEIATGKTYYNKNWKMRQKIALIRNMAGFRSAIKSGSTDAFRKDIKLVP